MAECSVILPYTKLEDRSSLMSEASLHFGVPSEDIELYALVPLSEAPSGSEVAIRLKSWKLTVNSIESLLEKQELLKNQLNRCKEALKSSTSSSDGSALERKYKRAIEKLTKVNEDNKKLRSLLKSQLENSESLRQETQQTVETLREEFERLVKEMSFVPKNKRQTSLPRSKKS